jgi:hypothetical protein
MSESYDIPLETIVYEIRRGENNLDEILAYQEDPKNQEKNYIFYTFQTTREIPEVLEIYREGVDKPYPPAFIVPSPSPEMNGQTLSFDGNFFLFVGYTRKIPPNLSLYNLLLTCDIEISKRKDKLEMRINGFIGLDILRVLAISQKYENPKEYISSLKKEYILHLENVTNLEDLNSFLTYNKEYLEINGENIILRCKKEYPRSNIENKIEKFGWFILIDDDTSKNTEFTPTYVKIFDIFV